MKSTEISFLSTYIRMADPTGRNLHENLIRPRRSKLNFLNEIRPIHFMYNRSFNFHANFSLRL